MLTAISLMLPFQSFGSEVWLSGVDPFTQAHSTQAATVDYQSLFQQSAPWEQAATGLKVFKTSTQWIMNAPDASLTAMFVDLKRRGIALAVEAGMMPLPSRCGSGVEGYSGLGTMAALAARIKKLGGDLKYVAMDEPLWYGHHYQGANACKLSIQNLATSLATNAAAIRAVFPDAIIGDIEPLTNTVSDWLDEVMEFATAYRTATGTPLNFIDADIQWNENYLFEVQQFVSRVRGAGIRVGLIYNGDPADQTDAAWTAHAEQRFDSIESNPALIPDQAIIQTWMSHPTHMLPETQPGTMTYLVDRYLAMRTNLTVQAAGSQVTGQLTKEDGVPVPGASVTVNAIDTSVAGLPRTVTMSGTVPANAVAAVWAMRINTECSCSGPANITVGTMTYTSAGTSVTRHFNMTHYVATATYTPNAAAFPVKANQAFTLSVPMQIPYASRNSGYIALIWLGQSGKEVARQELPFQPGTVPVGTVVTDASGKFSIPTTNGSAIFSATYAGSAEWDRAIAVTSAAS